MSEPIWISVKSEDQLCLFCQSTRLEVLSSEGFRRFRCNKCLRFYSDKIKPPYRGPGKERHKPWAI